MMREPTEPQASIKATGVGIPHLQAWEEVKFVMPFPVIMCTMIALVSVMKENDDRLMIGYFKA